MFPIQMENLLMRTDLMPNIRYWFPTAVYDVNLGDDFINNNSLYYTKAIEYRERYKNNVTWKCDTYTTLDSVDLNNEKEFQSLIKKCKEHVLNFADHFGISNKTGRSIPNLQCKDAWLNIASPGNYQEYHIHGNSHFSLVYYVRTPENCGDLIFRSATADNMFPLPKYIITDVNTSTAAYKPEEGRLLIFPSNLSHLVCKNESEQDRVSISMNFVFD